MTNLVEIQLQIQKLQKQASQIKAKEFHKTVLEINEKMQAFGITLKDLQGLKVVRAVKGSGDAKKIAKVAAKRQAPKVVADKFEGPEGQKWTGRGLTPRWLKALVEQGQSKEEFLIERAVI